MTISEHDSTPSDATILIGCLTGACLTTRLRPISLGVLLGLSTRLPSFSTKTEHLEDRTPVACSGVIGIITLNRMLQCFMLQRPGERPKSHMLLGVVWSDFLRKASGCDVTGAPRSSSVRKLHPTPCDWPTSRLAQVAKTSRHAVNRRAAAP